MYNNVSNHITNSVITDSVIGGNVGDGGSGVSANRRVYPKKSFNKIAINVPADITINHSSKNSINIETDENLIDKISFYIQNGTLFFKMKGNINSTTGLNIAINSRYLKRLNVNSASDIEINNFSLKKLYLNINSATDIKFNSANINNLYIDADGSYDIDLSDSRVRNAHIRANGSGDITLNVSHYLDVFLSGSTDVKYMGNPRVKKFIEGSSDLTKI
jgi:hypothetical protein